MRFLIALVVLLTTMLACKNERQNTPAGSSISSFHRTWRVQGTESSYIVFDDNSRIDTKLFDMSYLCSLSDSMGKVYFVLSGRTCKECDENISIFLYTPKDTLKPVSELAKYTYPGKEFDYENDQLIFESRLYVGDRFHNGNLSNCLIWVQSERNNSDKIDSSMFIVDIVKGKIEERKISSQAQEYRTKLQLVMSFKEIKGIEITSEP